MKGDILIERQPGYKIYYSDGRFFVDMHQTIVHSYAFIDGAIECVYNAGLREDKVITDEIVDKLRKIGRQLDVVSLDSKQVMEILDEMDYYRRHNINFNNPDYAMRVAEAILAKAAGFKDRNEWCELLKADSETKYAKDYADATVAF